MSPVARAAWFAAVLVAITPAVGRAQTRIALSGETSAPGTGVFTEFDHAPAASGGVVAFRGLYAGGQGIYTGTGGTPVLIANSATTVPGGGMAFGNLFGSPAISNSTVVFAGGPPAAPPFPFRGVYAAPAGGGAITAAADNTTTNPGPPAGPFNSFDVMPGVSGSTVAFGGGSAFRGGIYTIPAAGALTATAIAQTGDAIPVVGGPFGSFSFPSVSGNRVAFVGVGPGGGVFTAATSGGALSAVATTSTTIPGGGGATFAGFGNPVVSGTVVAFAGGPTGGPGSFPTGIYTNTGAGGSLVAVANTSTTAPGGGGLFTQFDPWVSLSGDDVVFVGHSSAGEGLYTNATGPLTRLVGQGDVFDGRTVADVEIGRQSFDGAFVTFWASFTDGRSGVYVVPVPEPAGVLAVAAAGAGLLRLRRTRHGRATSCGPRAAS